MSKATIRKTSELLIIVVSAYLLGWYHREVYETVNQAAEEMGKAIQAFKGSV